MPRCLLFGDSADPVQKGHQPARECPLSRILASSVFLNAQAVFFASFIPACLMLHCVFWFWAFSGCWNGARDCDQLGESLGAAVPNDSHEKGIKLQTCFQGTKSMRINPKDSKASKTLHLKIRHLQKKQCDTFLTKCVFPDSDPIKSLKH